MGLAELGLPMRKRAIAGRVPAGANWSGKASRKLGRGDVNLVHGTDVSAIDRSATVVGELKADENPPWSAAIANATPGRRAP